MKRMHGDLWTAACSRDDLRVIPVNCGFNDRGLAIMGAGVALQAADRFPSLRAVWGKRCIAAAHDGVLPEVHVDWTSQCVLFPTKGRNDENPALSWQKPALPWLVAVSAHQLAQIIPRLPSDSTVYLPLVGCGLGQLRREEVLPILDRHLDDRFILVEEPVWNSSTGPGRNG